MRKGIFVATWRDFLWCTTRRTKHGDFGARVFLRARPAKERVGFYLAQRLSPGSTGKREEGGGGDSVKELHPRALLGEKLYEIENSELHRSEELAMCASFHTSLARVITIASVITMSNLVSNKTRCITRCMTRVCYRFIWQELSHWLISIDFLMFQQKKISYFWP